MSLGSVQNDCIQCPFHGIAFDGEGNCTDIPFVDEPAVRNKMSTQAFRVTEKYGFTWMWNGENYSGQEPVIFSDLDRGYAYHSMNKNWNTHYTRAIENQLDYYHLPFVHKNTIGRGFKPASSSELSSKLSVTFENETISCCMKTESGSGEARFRFMFPNAWQLRLSPFAFLFVAFCPVDEENTVMILRTYIRGKQLKGLKSLALKSSPIFNHKILSEDEAVVLSQTPKEISKDMHENLLALDKPIAVFRKHYFSKLEVEKPLKLVGGVSNKASGSR